MLAGDEQGAAPRLVQSKLLVCSVTERALLASRCRLESAWNEMMLSVLVIAHTCSR